MRKTVVIALFLLVALAAYILVKDERETSPPYRDVAQPPGVELAALQQDDDGTVLTEPGPEPEPAVPDVSSEDCSEIYREQMTRLESEVLTEDLADQVVQQARWDWMDSSNLQLKVFAAQLLDNYDDGIALFARELQQPITSPHFLWSAVNMCLANREFSACPIEDWLEQLIAVDSQNSLVWIRAAGYYHSIGDPKRARAALDPAVIAYEVNDYWLENIMSAKTSIDVVGGLSDRVGYFLAIAVSTFYPSSRVLYEQMCKEMSAKNAVWLSSCVAYGEHVSRIATREKVRSNAMRLQADALIASGDPEDSPRVSALFDSPPAFRAEELYRYPDSVAIYLSSLASSGAIAAADALLTEHERRKREGIDPECGDINRD
ncbi:MAG: hypothetical protein QNJ05_12410 [Woeseiaceae bacterium]|nr:hypothetical protein [Woeseiaceae bacterium]